MKRTLLTLIMVCSLSALYGQRADSIEASFGFQHDFEDPWAKGDYEIFSTTDTSLELIDKPIIVVEGWDPFGIFNTNKIYDDFNWQQTNWLGDSLQARGYDIIVLNFKNGADWIQKSAFLLMELIDRVNANKVGNEKIIVCGISMGGLAARYALTFMEGFGWNHDCGLFISFDAPQKGANVPLGSQVFALKTPFLQTILGQVITSKPASRQMLVNTADPFDLDLESTNESHPHADFEDLFEELDIRGYPQQTRNIAISNGVINGQRQLNLNNQPMQAGDVFLSAKWSFGMGSCGVEKYIMKQAKAQGDSSNSDVYVSSQQICLPEGNIFQFISNIINGRYEPSHGSNVMKFYPTEQGWDFAPGSQDPIIHPLISEIALDSTDIEFLSVPTTFITTCSALDIDTNVLVNIFDINGDIYSPFSEFYAPNLDNQNHTALPPITANWLFSQIVRKNPDTLFFTDDSYNYAQDANSFLFKVVKVTAGGKLQINQNMGADQWAKNLENGNEIGTDTGSTFRLKTWSGVNNKTTVINDSAGQIIIGDPFSNRRGELIISYGCALDLKPHSTLIINNNSKLVIEHGSSLKFFPNSQIILNGSNAILEIRGNLEIMNGATFTVSGGSNGMGKIIFNKNWTPDQPDYVGGNGNFVLNGTSKNTPHIEIYGNIGLKFGYGLNKVEIKNTEIIIDQPSTLCFLNNITKMENVKVSPINGMRHGGIKAVNRSQHFRNVDIYFAKTGITVFNNGYNGSMLLQDVTVSHSDYGIHAVGGCRINHNKGGLNNIGLTAFLGSGLLGNSGVRGLGISRDINFPMVAGGRVGLNVQGYEGGVFDIRKNTVIDFQTGVSVNNSRADLRCNNIFYNQTGIFASDAALSLVRNNLSNNDHSWTQYGGTYHIENGLNYFHANDFYFEHWNLAVSQYKYSNPAYVYNTNTPQYFVPDAQNAWGNNPLTGHNPADGFSYNKDYYINSVGLYPPPEPIMGSLAQNTPLSYNNFSNTDVTACPEINTSSSPMGTTTSSDISKSPPPMTYNTGALNGGWGGDIPVDGGSADLVLNDIKNRIYDYNSIPDITSIVSNLSDILFYPYQMTETQVVLLPYVVNDDTLYVQDTIEVILIEEEALTSVLMNAYHLMLECVSRAHEVSSYELNDSFQLFYAVANTLLDNIDDLIILSQNNHFLWSAVPFNLYIDKTNIQRFVYELDNAQTTLTQATSYIALPFQQNIYERLSCILDAEISIRDSLTLPQDIESNHPCLFADYSNIPPMLQSMALSNKPLSNSKTDPTITIYPNPASKELFVQTAADAGTYFIYNIAGSLVAAGRLNDKRIDISELSEGLYFIRLNTAAQTYHAKFVVAKE
ncbi:MAG: T9SS type A sorting domain-containing protein [Bacteroidia bacterium]|nr:T9SS type A sorting domain-containing protein [Bacteroidia bacterium]